MRGEGGRVKREALEESGVKLGLDGSAKELAQRNILWIFNA